MTEVESDALRLLTRNEGTPYLEYVAYVKTRIKNPTAEDLERVAKYRLALEILGR